MSDWIERSLKTGLADFKRELDRTTMSPSTKDIHIRCATRFAVFLLEDGIDSGTVDKWKRELDGRG